MPHLHHAVAGSANGYEPLSNDDDAVIFYTELAGCAVFNHVLKHALSCFPALPSKAACWRAKLSDANRLLLTLM